MSGLERRLDALEQLAEQVRRREWRDLLASWPEAHDLTPAELEAATDEALRCWDRITAWKREGLSKREILQRYADEQGMPVDEIERECAALVAETGVRSEAYR